MSEKKKKRTSGHIYDNRISMSKQDMDDTCRLRHEIGRAGKACCNCIWANKCGRREDK